MALLTGLSLNIIMSVERDIQCGTVNFMASETISTHEDRDMCSRLVCVHMFTSLTLTIESSRAPYIERELLVVCVHVVVIMYVSSLMVA